MKARSVLSSIQAVTLAGIFAFIFWHIFNGTRQHPLLYQDGSYRTNIERVLKEDAATSDQDSTEGVERCVRRMKDIDITGCPDDFRDAYRNHIHAWEDRVAVHKHDEAVATYLNSPQQRAKRNAQVYMGLTDVGLAEIDDIRRQLLAEFRENDQEIRKTFQHVEDIAVSHGVRLPEQTIAIPRQFQAGGQFPATAMNALTANSQANQDILNQLMASQRTTQEIVAQQQREMAERQRQFEHQQREMVEQQQQNMEAMSSLSNSTRPRW